MAAHFVAGYRGKEYTKQADFTFDTSTTAAADIELRIEDALSLNRKDVVQFCEGIIRLMQSGEIAGLNFPDK